MHRSKISDPKEFGRGCSLSVSRMGVGPSWKYVKLAEISSCRLLCKSFSSTRMPRTLPGYNSKIQEMQVPRKRNAICLPVNLIHDFCHFPVPGNFELVSWVLSLIALLLKMLIQMLVIPTLPKVHVSPIPIQTKRTRLLLQFHQVRQLLGASLDKLQLKM